MDRSSVQKAVAVVLALLIVVLIALGLYGACGSRDDALACVRDVAIIVLVIETFAVTLLLLLIVVLIARLVNTIQNEVKPVLESAKRTADTVQGTTTFVSNAFVAPLINLAGLAAGIKGVAAALAGRRKTRRN